jgi:hypothetical protein
MIKVNYLLQLPRWQVAVARRKVNENFEAWPEMDRQCHPH